MNSNENTSDNDTGPALPPGVLRSRGGWEDVYNIEIEHQRERLRAGGADEHDHSARGKSPPTHAAVDLAQFRNEEVGKGYQAKHVFRQKEAHSSATGLVDMSGGAFSKKKKKERGGVAESSANRKRSHDDEDDGGKNDRNDGKKTQPTADVRLESYIKCKGMRDFMKEIENILKK